jgi:hypothetical protein
MDRDTPSERKRTFVLELNEVNLNLLSDLVTAGRLPAFNRLFQTHRLIPTMAREPYGKLEPWIQWVSAHSGLNQAQHGAFNLTDAQHAEFDQVWDLLEDAGIPCGVVSPMNARRGRLKRGFYMPDPWSAARDVYPDELAPIDRFVSERVNNHNISLEKGSSKGAFAQACLDLGLPPRALARLGWHYVRSRIDPRTKWRLAAQFDRFVVEVTLAMMRRRPVQHASVFLNGVAHYQHHYWSRHNPTRWARSAPGLFRHVNPLERENLKAEDDPIAYGFSVYDKIVARVRQAAPDARLLIVTALSQVPFEGYEGGRGFFLYRPYDHDKLFEHIGLGASRVVPLMSRDVMLYFPNEAARAAAVARLHAFRVGDEPVFAFTEESGNRLFVKVAYTFAADPFTRIDRADGPPMTFLDWFKLITFKTGHHHPQGFLLCPPDLMPRAEDLVDGQLPVERVFDLILSAHGVERLPAVRPVPALKAS